MIKNENKIKAFQLEGDFNIYFMDERIYASAGWQMTKAQAQRIFAALDKNELVSFTCECPMCNDRSPLARMPINDLGLGGDIRIGCQRIPASVLDYAREWANQ